MLYLYECFESKAAAQVLGMSVNHFSSSRDDVFYSKVRKEKTAQFKI